MSATVELTDPRPTASGGPLRVALIIGSVREGRVGCSVARWAATHAERRADLDIDVVDLRDIDLPDDLTPGLRAWTERVAAAAAFVVVTPEYNRGIPAALKHAIDAVREEWFAKPMNQAQAERAAAQAEIDAAPKRGAALDVAEVYAMIDSLGDVGATLADARPAALNRLYKELNISAIYQPEERAVDVTARPRVDSARVRGGSCALTTRLLLS